MGPIPFAFSVSHFINSVGADAGFASIIGLAVLVLLYFAQARETSSLREQAYESAQRVQQLEARITQLGRQPLPVQPAAAPVSAPAQALRRPSPSAVPVGGGALAPAPVAAMAAAPAAPAGVGAPALTAATRLIPDGGPAGAQAAPGSAGPAVPDEEAPRVPVGPRPATVAGAANGTAQAPPAPAPGSEQPPPRIQIRPPAAAAPGRRPVAPPRPPARSGSTTGRRVLAGALVVLSIAAVVVALLVLTSSGGGSSASSASSSAASNAPTTTRNRKAAAAVTPSSVTVAVLNGTATSGLAHRVAVKLAATGYKQGTVATATDQTRTATVVAYMPGHRKEAVSVASSLKLGSASVQPIDQNTQAVACPPPGACTSGVVVTVGSDLANIQ